MQSVLSKAAPGDFRADPFPHVVLTDALDPAYYEALAAQFPPVDVVNASGKALGSNTACLLGARAVLDHPRIAKDWQEFFAHHVSPAFWQEAIGVCADAFRSAQPAAETQLGARLETLASAVAGDPVQAEVALDCQFGINTPVTTRSSVRTAHVDRPNKVFNALLYCRDPRDDAPGGELILYRFVKAPAFYRGRTAMPTRIAEVARVPYAANTLVLFVNGPHGVHGVSPRPPTSHVRRYVNFHAELSRHLFTLPALNPVLAFLERCLAA